MLDDLAWKYPCGGLGPTTNRTKWPISGGAIAFQPGHNAGHSTAFIYINMFVGNNNTLETGNYFNISIKPVFQIVAPNNTNEAFDSTICFQSNYFTVPNTTVIEPGTNATIQIIELAKNGNALYSCSDITFEDPALVPVVGKDVCFNDTGFGIQEVFTTKSLSVSSANTMDQPTLLMIGLALLATSVLIVGS